MLASSKAQISSWTAKDFSPVEVSYVNKLGNSYNERIHVITESLPAIAAREEYGGLCSVEARIASLTDGNRRPFGGDIGHNH